MDFGFSRYRRSRNGRALDFLAWQSSRTGARAAMRCLALVVLLGGVSGCGSGEICSPGTGTPMLVAQLFFGLAIPGRGQVTNEEWAGFVDQILAPALPDGFTVLDADGAWMNPATRTISRERAKVLVVALRDTSERIGALDAVRNAYQLAFRQQLVGMTVVRGCASF